MLAFNIDLSEVVSPPGGVWHTFNDFFIRELLPSARPIARPDDDAVLVSPADCRLAVFPTCLDATRVWIKGDAFTIRELLGEPGAHLVPLFASGSIIVARLAPQDYHRQVKLVLHMPTANPLTLLLLSCVDAGEQSNLSPTSAFCIVRFTYRTHIHILP